MKREQPKHTLRRGDLAYYDCRNMGFVKCKVVTISESDIVAVVTAVGHHIWKKDDMVVCDNQDGASLIVPRTACKRFDPVTGQPRGIENFKVEVDHG